MTNRVDNFNRTVAVGLGTPSDGGTAWTTLFDGDGAWLCNGTQGVNAVPSVEMAYLDTGTSDVDVQVTAAGTVSDEGPAARITDNNNWWYGSCRSAACYIFKRQAGSYTTFGPYGAVSSGSAVKLHCLGTTIELYVGGVSQGSTTDSFNQTATKHGLGDYQASGTFDDWSSTDLGASDTLMPQICM